MSTRLIRALQRGGCAVEATNGNWMIWRGSDRRGRSIGELRGGDVGLLRIRGDLALAGGADDGRLVWAGTIAPLDSDLASVGIAADDPSVSVQKNLPLLQRLLEGVLDPPERRRLAQLNTLLGRAEMQLLEKMIIEFQGRAAISTWLGLRPKQAELHSARVLARLADAYDRKVTSPPRKMPPRA